MIFKLSAFQLNLLLFISNLDVSKFLVSRRRFSVPIIHMISVQIMFVMSKLSIKSINTPVKVSTGGHPVFTASSEIYFCQLILKVIMLMMLQCNNML